MATRFFSVDVIVKFIKDPQSRPSKLVRLNLKDNLLKIRQNLEKVIDNTLLFSKKYADDDNISYAEIAIEKERNHRLNEIIDNYNGKKILYLKQCSKPDWK